MKRLALVIAVSSLALFSMGAKRAPKASEGRRAAQHGLDFLARSTPAWQDQHKCYGCHVQAVTMQAIATATQRDYGVTKAFVDSVLAGLTTVNGGARSQHGLSHSGGREGGEAKSYGGSALAVYDQHVSEIARDDLLSTARALLAFQTDDGSVPTDVARFPVSPSTVHTTYRAVQTWRQAYARTADDAWRAPLRRGEAFLAAQAKALVAKADAAPIQDLNFAALGLIEAGVGASEPVLTAVVERLRGRQLDNGGWALTTRNPKSAAPYATGQTLYTLRMLGIGESDAAIVRGTAWLVKNQKEDGAWSSGGTAKAEAMWAVLGLVSIDVVGLDIAGVRDGDRVDGKRTFTANAKDNHGTTVEKIEVFIDDDRAQSTKGDKMTFVLDATGLSEGPHLIDVVATNREGRTGRRRLVVYSGNYFLTDVGSQFADDGTSISLRSLAGGNGAVRLEVLDKGKVVQKTQQAAQGGAMRFFYKPKTAPAVHTTFEARLSFVKDGKVVQTVKHEFVHASALAQRENFGDVQGKLSSGARDLANTWIELVDERGQVVRRTRSTRSGQYRFKNIDQGKYKVRVNKKGFKGWENDVKVQRGQEALNDVEL